MPRPQFNQEIVDRNTWLKSLSLETLQELARTRGVSNYKRMDNKQLIDVLTQMGVTSNPLSTPKTDSMVQ